MNARGNIQTTVNFPSKKADKVEQSFNIFFLRFCSCGPTISQLNESKNFSPLQPQVLYRSMARSAYTSIWNILDGLSHLHKQQQCACPYAQATGYMLLNSTPQRTAPRSCYRQKERCNEFMRDLKDAHFLTMRNSNGFQWNFTCLKKNGSIPPTHVAG